MQDLQVVDFHLQETLKEQIESLQARIICSRMPVRVLPGIGCIGRQAVVPTYIIRVVEQEGKTESRRYASADT